jgi:two-component system alkaline phosphatase synthesis response regulator PhoP
VDCDSIAIGSEYLELALQLCQRPGYEMPAINSNGDLEELYTVGALRFYPERYEVRVGDRVIELTQMEVRMLRALAEHPNRFLVHREISLRVWGEMEVPTNRIASIIFRLRAKIENDPSQPTFIVGTMTGKGGYKLAE